jgi:hypothetical protein
MTKKEINETIEKFLQSDRVDKATDGDEIAIRKQAPDWLKEMIKEDDSRITKH